MPSRLLLALSRRPKVKRVLASNNLTRRVVNRFVAGESLDDGIRAAERIGALGAATILDYLGENVRSEERAEHAVGEYLAALEAIPEAKLDAHISVKLTQLGLDTSFEHCASRLTSLCRRAQELGTKVAVDMESHEYTQQTVDMYVGIREQGIENIVLCLQAYLRRTPSDVERLLPLEPAIRLCKGAYDEPREIALSPRETREAFNRLAQVLIERTPYTAIATHDPGLIEYALALPRRGDRPNFEFQMLYGVRRDLQRSIVAQGHCVRVYIPYGSEWYSYLMRRLAERPANLRFFLEALVRG